MDKPFTGAEAVLASDAFGTVFSLINNRQMDLTVRSTPENMQLAEAVLEQARSRGADYGDLASGDATGFILGDGTVTIPLYETVDYLLARLGWQG